MPTLTADDAIELVERLRELRSRRSIGAIDEDGYGHEVQGLLERRRSNAPIPFHSRRR
ncbi:MAG TPA: hypothetical protein VGH94_01335 [Acidimicrobiales bacterium]|jgi:hypothetical protein